ncbi:MAG: hypothetical protein GWP56_10085 [Gammaproteobacteria bacterium]|jgi:hypothetical protein|nr:hypothetical protein [Gammaproteobacteria bacterium]
MKHVDTYDKTVNGKNEVTDNAAGLSMMERRVLILVNGENEVEKLAKLSLCDDIDATLDRLLELGLIQVAETTLVEIAPQAAPEKAAAADDVTVTARDLMCNTLQTFGNKVKIAGLHQTISEINDLEALKDLVKPWYQALSETPGGMYQADDLRKEVLELLQREDADAA